MATRKEIVAVDKEINENDMTVILNKINGTEVEAIFTTFDKAIRYRNRLAVNLCVDHYSDYVKDLDDDEVKNKKSFSEFVEEFLDNNDTYVLESVSHLDPSKPIYVMQNRNYHVRGHTEDYLTNSLDDFKKKNLKKTCSEKDKIEWIEQCTVKVDPPLPQLEFENAID